MKLPFVWHCDWLLDLISKINGFRVTGIEFIPFVVVVRDLNDRILINHETIHFRQMCETLFVGYYLIYIVHYLCLRSTYGHQLAYRMICFEKEAYANQADLEYPQTRKCFAWARK